jgi:hypothetical protein
VGAKAIMKWSGASERAVKGWLSGCRGPSGEHLISLMANSETVAATVMCLAGKRETDRVSRLAEARRLIDEAMLTLDEARR